MYPLLFVLSSLVPSIASVVHSKPLLFGHKAFPVRSTVSPKFYFQSFFLFLLIHISSTFSPVCSTASPVWFRVSPVCSVAFPFFYSLLVCPPASSVFIWIYGFHFHYTASPVCPTTFSVFSLSLLAHYTVHGTLTGFFLFTNILVL
jgi:hypothetical protein